MAPPCPRLTCLQLCTCDLAHWLADRGGLSEREAAHITRQLLTALAACHSLGVAYHDVKPANLLLRSLDAASGLPHICLADFGCAHSTLEPQAGARHSPGTPLFRQAPLRPCPLLDAAATAGWPSCCEPANSSTKMSTCAGP